MDQNAPITFKEILSTTDVGKKYNNLLNKYTYYPALIDNNNQIISFPPIINSNITKLTNKSNNLFIEITGTNLETCKSISAILSYYLYEEGFKIYSGIVHDGKSELSTLKILKDKEVFVDKDLINRYLGLDLTFKEIVEIYIDLELELLITNNKKIKCLYLLIETTLFIL